MKAGILVAAAALTACTAAQAEGWQWSVTPYLWATDTGVDVRVRDTTLVDTTIPFEDLLKDIKAVAQFRAEAMHGAHGLALDLFNVALSPETATVNVPGDSGAQATIDADIGMTIFDLTGVYDPRGDGKGLRFSYGARLISQREELDASLSMGGNAGPAAHYEADDTYLNALVGVRYTKQISARWSYTLNADIGTGGTDLTWSVGPYVGYSFGDEGQYRLIGGYRHLVVDFKDEAETDMELTLSGFLVGFRIAF
jgi:hypothetical protein